MYLQAGRNFGLSTPRAPRARRLPGRAARRSSSGLRIALGIAWLVVVAAEMIAVDSGLGYLIIDSRNAGKRYDLVVAGMLLIGAIGLVLDTLARRLERLRTVRWGFQARVGVTAHEAHRRSALGAWLARRVTASHSVAERELGRPRERLVSPEKRKLNVAYIPVTCHLACPVTDYISQFSRGRRALHPAHVPGLSRDQGGPHREQDAGGVHRRPDGDRAEGAGRRDPDRLPRAPLRQRRRRAEGRPREDVRGPQGTHDRDAEPLLRRAPHRLPRPQEVRHEARRT